MSARVPLYVAARSTAKQKRQRTRSGIVSPSYVFFSQPLESSLTNTLGCLVCKRRKVKCDEGKPSCGQCRAKSLTCTYDRNATRTRVNNDARNTSTALGSIQAPTVRSSSWESVDPDRVSHSIHDQDVVNSQVEEPLAKDFCAQMTRNIIRSVDCPGNPHLDVFKCLMQSPTVLHASRALANLHNSAPALCPEEVVRSRTASLKHQGTAIQLLKRDLQIPKLAHTDAVLAATILLYLFEKVGPHPSTQKQACLFAVGI